MRLRDAAEHAIRRWHAYELTNGGKPIIDFDCAPTLEDIAPYESRFAALADLTHLASAAVPSETTDVVEHLTAHTTYLAALMGQPFELDEYVLRTQGCRSTGWTPDYVAHRGDLARTSLHDIGIAWGVDTDKQLKIADEQIAAADVSTVIGEYAARFETTVRSLADTDAEFELTVEDVSTDEYWSYWLDGKGHQARLRINRAKASFSRSDCYRFALHEVLGHALHYSSLTAQAERADVPWPRLLCVHCPHQVLFEGLAQVLPLIASPDDELVRTRTYLDHYTQLVRATLHLLINSGASVATSRETARELAPWWEDQDVERELRDRSQEPQLRSYLWSYPAGIDWFVHLYEAGGTVLAEVLREAYKRPLTPSELQQLWPAGPAIGGNQ